MAKTKTFQCPRCSKVLSRSTVLKDHLRAHDKERPYPCTHLNCTKVFTRRPDLLQHRRLHSGLRDYICQRTDDNGDTFGCGKRFDRKRDLERHWKRAGGWKFQSPRDVTLPPDPPISANPDSFGRVVQSASKSPLNGVSPPQMEQPVEAFYDPYTLDQAAVTAARTPLDCDDTQCKEFGGHLETEDIGYILHMFHRHFYSGQFTCPYPCKTSFRHLITLLSHCHLEHGMQVQLVAEAHIRWLHSETIVSFARDRVVEFQSKEPLRLFQMPCDLVDMVLRQDTYDEEDLEKWGGHLQQDLRHWPGKYTLRLNPPSVNANGYSPPYYTQSYNLGAHSYSIDYNPHDKEDHQKGLRLSATHRLAHLTLGFFMGFFKANAKTEATKSQAAPVIL